MRNLNAEQKRMLSKWAKENGKEGAIIDAEDLPIYWEVYELNPFENFNSAVESFIQDMEVKE